RQDLDRIEKSIPHVPSPPAIHSDRVLESSFMIWVASVKDETLDEKFPDLPSRCLLFRVRALAISLDAPHRERAAIRKHHTLKLYARRAGPGRVSGDGYFVPGLQQILAKARAGQHVRIAQLGAPMHDVALLVRHVEQNAAMGVGPNPFCDCPLQRYPLVLLIRHASSVVCEQRGAQYQNARGQDRRGCENSPQRVTSGGFLACRL